MLVKSNIKISLFTIILCLLSLYSCKHDSHDDEHYHTIVDKIEAKSKHYKGVSLTSDTYNSELKTLEVSEDGNTFLIPERKGEIQSFACSECHSKPLNEMQSIPGNGKKSHWNIKLNHAGSDIMKCTTCHTGNDMDNLHSLTDAKIDFDRSYKLCSQCHQEQFKDWKGGAHGKRIGGWAPPRVSKTCVNCHNPHKPRFESRMPARYNTQKVEERK